MILLMNNNNHNYARSTLPLVPLPLALYPLPPLLTLALAPLPAPPPSLSSRPYHPLVSVQQPRASELRTPNTPTTKKIKNVSDCRGSKREI